MAGKTTLEKLQSKYAVKGVSKTNTPVSNTSKMQNQVNNYKTRLEAAGSDYDASDNRNALEKALNLEKDQNVLFDILEIINRPQNALLTGINNALSGDNFFEGLKEGITGETKTTGKDILVDQLGMDDEQGKLDWADVLGFGVDLVTDPMDYLILPAKGVGLAGDASKALSRVDEATQALNAARKLGDTNEIAKAAKSLYRAQTVSDKAQDALAKVSKSVFYNNGKAVTSGFNVLGKGIGKGIKNTGKLADKAIEGTLSTLDARNAKKIQALVDQGMNATEAARKLNINPDKLGLYQDIKKGIKNTIDSASNIGGFVGRSRGYDAATDLDNIFGTKANQEIRTVAENIAPRVGMSADDIMQKGVNAIESNRNWDLTGQDIINRFKESRNVDFLSTKQAEKVQKILDQFGIKTTLDETGRVLNMSADNLKKLYTVQEAPLSKAGKALKKGSDKSTIFRDYIFGSKNYDEINELLKADREFFKQTPELRELYNTMENAVKEQASLTSDVTKGLNAGEAATTDYVKHSQTDESLRRVSEKEFKAREANMDASIAQVNRMEEEKRVANLAKEEKALDRDLKSIYKTELDADGNEILVTDKNGNYIRDDVKYNNLVKNKENVINNIKKRIQSNKEVSKYIKEGSYDASKLTKAGETSIKRIDRAIDAQIGVNDMMKEISDYMDEIKELKNLTPEGLEALNDLGNDFNELSKLYTELKNRAPQVANKFAKGKGDEIGGLFTADKQMKQLFERVTEAKNKVRETLTITKAANTNTYKEAVGDALKAYKKGVEAGEKITKESSKLKKGISQVNTIRETSADIIDASTKRLNLEKEALKNLRNAREDIYNKTLESIKHHTEQIELLKSQEGQQFFKTKFDEIFPDYVKASAKQNAGTKKFYDALANNLFDNEEYIKVAKEGEKLGYGYTRIKGNKLIDKFNSYKPIMTEEGRELGEVLNKFADKDIIIDKHFATALDVASKTDRAQLNPLFRLWDGMNNTFKKFSTITPGFQIRNMIGNSTDMVLSGVNPAELPKYYKEAHSIWKNADDLMSKARKGLLNEAEAKQFDILKQFYQGGFADAMKKGYGLEGIAEAVNKNTKNPINKVSRWSINANETVDAYNRLTLLLYANNNPKYLEKLGKKNAIDAVKYVLFDPRNLSDSEKAFKRVVPFYTFTKQNLMFQASNALKNTGRYSKLYKALRDGYNDLDEGTYNAYQRDSMQIPLPFTGSDGNQLFLKANLPVSDLGEFLGSPIQRTVASLSPVIKTPIEMTTGKNLFTGNESNYTTLSSSRLSKKLNDTLDSMGISTTGITKVEDAADLILNNFGLQNVSTNLVKKVESILDNADGTKSGQQMWAEIFRSILQNTKEESIRNSGLYDELQAYQAEIQRLKNQGIDVPTIKEINASNKIKINKLKKKRASSN